MKLKNNSPKDKKQETGSIAEVNLGIEKSPASISRKEEFKFNKRELDAILNLQKKEFAEKVNLVHIHWHEKREHCNSDNCPFEQIKFELRGEK